MTTYKIYVKQPWAPQVKEALVSAKRLTWTDTSAINDGSGTWRLHLAPEDRVVFLTQHKRDLPGRIGAPGGNAFEKWVFTTEFDSLYLGFTDHFGHSDRGARHTPTNVPGVSTAIGAANALSRQAARSALVLSADIKTGSISTQITPKGKEKDISSLWVSHFDDQYALRGGSVDNRSLSSLLVKWYQNRPHGLTARLGAAFSDGAEITKTIFGR